MYVYIIDTCIIHIYTFTFIYIYIHSYAYAMDFVTNSCEPRAHREFHSPNDPPKNLNGKLIGGLEHDFDVSIYWG